MILRASPLPGELRSSTHSTSLPALRCLRALLHIHNEKITTNMQNLIKLAFPLKWEMCLLVVVSRFAILGWIRGDFTAPIAIIVFDFDTVFTFDFLRKYVLNIGVRSHK